MNNVYLEFQDLSSGLQHIQITKDITRLGREPGLDVVIASTAANVSRRHAEIRLQDGVYILVDLGSFNGSFLNGRRIAGGEILHDGDVIQLGPGGPSLRFRAPTHADAVRTAHLGHSGGLPQSGRLAQPKNQTIFASKESGALQATLRGGEANPNEPRVFLQRALDRPQLTIGRGDECDIRLDGLLISNNHARISQTSGGLVIEDLNSTNGTYVNGQRITGRRHLPAEDVVQIGPFLLRVNSERGVTVFDTRSKTRLDVLKITKEVTNRSGDGKIRLLDEVDLSIQPNEFVGLLGPSGAGKSTLMDSMNGMRPATSGHVLVNNLDLYQHLESLKQSIGYVPQDDIIHRELTVYRTLYYVARLRLSRDISAQEIDQVLNEVMDITGLSERRDVPISQLSGGQRKRVSIAVELITKPSVIFLDEPTSGLDPATEEKVMKLFRQIAESGRTVVLTTHAMENVKLFDKLVVLMRGKLVFYGKPQEALAHCGAESFKDLYDKLEAPIFEKLRSNGRANKDQIAEEVADDWKRRFLQTDQYRMNVEIPLRSVSANAHTAAPARRRGSFGDWLRQWATLSRRYLEVLSADKFNLLILFGQAPIIALLTYLVVGAKAPRDFIYFVLALVSLWFGTSVAAREIIRERAVYKRERMVNLRLLPYVGSKILILMLIVGLQCLLLFGTLKVLDLTKLMSFPGGFGGSLHLVVMIVTSMVGISLGLFVSAVVKTSEMATSLIPLILIPQILFCGLVGIPTGMSKVVGLAMPATWAFDGMKRLSELDVLRAKDEEAQPSEKEEGRGLYKQVERDNDQNIDDSRRKVDKYKADAEKSINNFEKKMEDYQKDLASGRVAKKPATPKLGPVPEIPPAKRIPDDLSLYVDFLHPWGSRTLDLGVLIAMFFTFLIATIIALRSQDV
jgi:ABC-type multidrug transport system ATPase subunit